MPPVRRNSGWVTSLPAVGGQNEPTHSPALDVSSAGPPGHWASAAGATRSSTKGVVGRKPGLDGRTATRESTISTTDSEEPDAARPNIAGSQSDPLGTLGARRMLWHDARAAMKEEAKNGETEVKRPSFKHAVKAVRKAMSFNLNRTKIINLFKTGAKQGSEGDGGESKDGLDREARELLADFQALFARVESEEETEEEVMLADFAHLASRANKENETTDTSSSIAAHAEKCLGLLSRLKMNALNDIKVAETVDAGNAKASDHLPSIARDFARPARAVVEWQQQQVPGQCNDAPEPRGSNMSGQNSSLLEFVKDTIDRVEEASRAGGAGKGEEDAKILLEEAKGGAVAGRRRPLAKWLGAVKLARSNMEFLGGTDNEELSQREQLDELRSGGLKSLLAEGPFQEVAARGQGGTAGVFAGAGSTASEDVEGAPPGEEAVAARQRRLRAVALAVTMWNRFQPKDAGVEQGDEAEGGSSASSGAPEEADSPNGARGEGTDTSETDEHMEDGDGAGAAVGARMKLPGGWRHIMSGCHDNASSDASPRKTSTIGAFRLETSSMSPQAPAQASVGRRRISTMEELRAPAHRILPGGASANCRQPVRPLHNPPQCLLPPASSSVSARSGGGKHLNLLLTGAAFSPDRPAVCEVPVQTQTWPSLTGGSFPARPPLSGSSSPMACSARRSSKTRAGRSEEPSAGEAHSTPRPAARLGVPARPGELRRRASA